MIAIQPCLSFLASKRKNATDELVAIAKDFSLSVPFGYHNEGGERGKYY